MEIPQEIDVEIIQEIEESNSVSGMYENIVELKCFIWLVV